MLAVALGAAVAGVAVAVPGSAAEAPTVPELTWSSCHVAYECATATVPLDYDDPTGETIELALIRKPATDPAHRIGSLFLNPGGPGGANTDLVSFTAITSALGDQVQGRFDLVGIDPRGTGGSTPVSCPESPDVAAVPAPPDPYPTEGQYDQHFAHDEYLRQTCAATAGPILDHMSIADTARDMELIRQAVGDEQLSFYGMSYGSVLGQTYAALYPDRIRVLAVDAVLDPEPWTAGELPPFQRVDTGTTTNETVLAAFAECDRVGVLRCALAGDAKARWERVRASLAEQPLGVGDVTLDGKSFVTYTQTAFQLDHMAGVPAPTVPLWFTAVRLIDTLRFGVAPPDALGQLSDILGQLDAGAPLAAADVTGGQAVVHGTWCADAEAPTDRQAWIDAADASDIAGLGIGRPHAWAMSVCAGWPGSSEDAYRGPFDVTTSTPPLMIGLTHDTVTSLAGARTAAAHYPGSRVIEVQTWGHTSLGKSNGCMKPALEKYLIERRLPDTDLVCQPDRGLF
jgi:pimeloyl-ACP methyl ester carboxylesterase